MLGASPSRSPAEGSFGKRSARYSESSLTTTDGGITASSRMSRPV